MKSEWNRFNIAISNAEQLPTRDTLVSRTRKTHLNKMKDEVLHFLAEMAVALAVVDAFIPRAEHYMKSKHSCKETESNQLHQYSDRLNNDIPDENKMHMHPPHYIVPPHFQHNLDAFTSRNQHVGAVLTYVLYGSGQYQQPESLLDKQERKKKNTKKNDISDALLSYPSIASAACTVPSNQQFPFFWHPRDRVTEKCRYAR